MNLKPCGLILRIMKKPVVLTGHDTIILLPVEELEFGHCILRAENRVVLLFHVMKYLR